VRLGLGSGASYHRIGISERGRLGRSLGHASVRLLQRASRPRSEVAHYLIPKMPRCPGARCVEMGARRADGTQR
jgi:hypothetical protein